MTGWNNSANIWRNIGRDRTDMLNASDKMKADAMSGMMSGAGQLLGAGMGLLAPSSREVKEEKREAKGVLAIVKKLPVEAWKYKAGVADEDEHIGTYAEDFTRETGLGDGKNLNLVDAIGVTMGAVKELAEEVDEIASGKEKPAQHRKAARKGKSKSIFAREAA